jgi:hypothetical protein
MSNGEIIQYDPSVEEVFNSISVREPVIDGEIDKKSIEKIDRQWRIATEIARRAISNTDVRTTLIGYNAKELSESLPNDAINKIANIDNSMSRLIKHSSEDLGVFLNHNEIPEELLKPDISHARSFTGIETEKERTYRDKQYYTEDNFKQLLDRKKNNGIPEGITKAERKLVSKRYSYARDIKMLGLMAELHDQPIDASNIDEGLVMHKLKSGIEIGVVSQESDLLNSMLDVGKWESRRQIKDRVYAIIVDGKEYIMKERKTNRHTDTMEHGHFDGLNSKKEFQVAKKLSELGTIRKGDIGLKWEKPIGYVEFPDGYQFCVFESDPGLKKSNVSFSSLQYDLEREILESKDRYKAEYDDVCLRSKDIYRDRKDLLSRYGFSDTPKKTKNNLISSIKSIFGKKVEQSNSLITDELTFEDFSKLKAGRLLTESYELVRRVAEDNGYSNRDSNGAYSINIRPGKDPLVEVIGFDFEYYYEMTEDRVESMKAYREKELANNIEANMGSSAHRTQRPIIVAASYALLEKAGYALPPIQNDI